MQQEDDHQDGGFAQDMSLVMGRRAALGGLGAMGGAAALWWFSGSGAGATVSGLSADGAVCVVPPRETAGPFPADGTNRSGGRTVNVLAETGVERVDIRDSFAGMTGRAEGVPLDLTIRLVDVDRACAPLSGLAVYIWASDAPGAYSIYERPEVNYQRGLQVSGADGTLRFVSTYPGCYSGRWPHFHFEVFASRDAATSGREALLTAQFALPEAESARVYGANATYGLSLSRLGRLSLTRDMIFRNNSAEELAAQTISLRGDPSAGLTGTVTVGLRL